MKLVNCGCGNKYDKRMINLDFYPLETDIIRCNLLKGLPFEEEEIDWIYNSHFLEHLSYSDALSFLRECYRVLKPLGGIRIVVPDLEEACRNYLFQLERAKEDRNYCSKYEYSVIELIDQMTRTKTGGRMADYWYSDNADLDFLKERVGNSVVSTINETKIQEKMEKKPRNVLIFAKSLMICLRKRIIKRMFSNTELYKTILAGKFEVSGEKHKWMYDSLGLSLLLEKAGFEKICLRRYMESDIPGFDEMKLEINDDFSEYKPNSIYIEAQKPKY